MTNRRWIGCLGLALLAVAACSGGDLVVELDLQSFVTDSGALPDPSADYSTPVLPVPVDLLGLEVLAPRSVGLVEAIDDLTAIRAVRVQYALQAVNRRGAGRAQVRMRLASTDAGLSAADAVFDTFSVALDPASDRTIDRSVDLPPRFVQLFSGSELWLAADADVRVQPASTVGDSLSGRLWLRGMRARLVAERDFF